MAKKEEKSSEKESQQHINHMLIENFVSLQKVLAELTSKFDKLSNNMSQLLNLFEVSARSFMSNPQIKDTEKDKEFLQKVDTLLEQNKTIAKGLTLMEDKMRERVYGGQGTREMPAQMMPSITQSQNIKKLPRF